MGTSARQVADNLSPANAFLQNDEHVENRLINFMKERYYREIWHSVRLLS